MGQVGQTVCVALRVRRGNCWGSMRWDGWDSKSSSSRNGGPDQKKVEQEVLGILVQVGLWME